MNNRDRWLVAWLLCLGKVSYCAGAEIPITNPTFEAMTGTNPSHFDGAGRLRDNHYSVVPGYPVEATGFQSANAIPGWQTTASAGTYNPPARLVPLEAPHGGNVAWVNVTGVLRQTLETTFQPNTTYQLTVEIGSLQGFEFPGYEVGLFAGGKVVVANTSLSAPAIAGQFSTVNASAWIAGDSSSVGQPIEIRLGIPGVGAGQVDFDWVRLTAMTVPEPASVALFAGGVVTLLLICRRGRRK